MTRSVTVLTNPHAGGGHPHEVAAAATARLRERGLEITSIEGRSASDALQLARDAVAAGTDALVAVGGDGLINIAWQALAGTGVPLGIIPGGTGNDHARLFHIPVDDPVAAADVVVDGQVADIDLGRVTQGSADEHWFGTVLASGFDSLVTDRANRMRWPRGPMRYNLAMVAELASLRAIPYRITLDDRTLELDAAMVSVGNGTSYGGGMLIAPSASLTDGQLDVIVVSPGSRLKLARLFPTVYKGTHVDLDEVQVFRSRRVRLEAPAPGRSAGSAPAGITAYADGERIAPLPIDIEAVPGAGRVIVGAPVG
ncbi:diacylglycerol kinase [Rhodococcus spelaei]|uniref:Diacylglycerol kinase n=1 Tax=Rhodococcus spelaei TaxID=2546320 RepID=A0A541AZ63_9NOCA|nr:diacylglycerol kinase [Rhodococcus spelaei]TQF65356.1 diacylglycerol kinase [Rhodococcus spelaei]